MGQLDTTRQVGCELCMQDGGKLILRASKLRVIRAAEADHPAFYRVIWNDHVREWTDLDAADRVLMMSVVERIEETLREHLQPSKVNLASLGNVVPHLHWHVIARFDWDTRWPAPVWAPPQREVVDAAARLLVPLDELDRLVAQGVVGIMRKA
ncbi:MAG: HIT family protein [Burkholderiales bacterium]|jgi:diadenosine tetraphosphate (Ap4A) HIT family hydrolase|nr:MAG: HIT family protein [Burkholderiales bacterium]